MPSVLIPFNLFSSIMLVLMDIVSEWDFKAVAG